MYDLRLKNIPAEVWRGILVLACTILLFTGGVKNVLPASGSVEKKVILIDAGHGGDDPGKIGINPFRLLIRIKKIAVSRYCALRL